MRAYAFTKMHGCGNDYICIDQFCPPYVRLPDKCPTDTPPSVRTDSF